ncbi:HsdM family class I SAM-dependent methyltransferase [Methanobrevibacter woesei]|uniref:HsdM family class I SAM-dependent methyltransferase n=1 Tax=Methanobrevibacter woesei TaxID=190976 RepID=UPI002354A256|nr:N-6 DNA methylase [Methanobrevibacter woesei]
MGVRINKTKNLGQVFTSEEIATFMCSLINKTELNNILEPSAGKGVFLKVLEENYKYKTLDAFEIDSTLNNVSNTLIYYENFLSQNISSKYDLIIGNPPYVRWKNIPNFMKDEFKEKYWQDKINGQSDLLYAFLFKSIDLLEENGELIFITPSFWTQTKHSKKLREYLLSKGHFELIINFNEIKLFKNISSNIIIFKFIKNHNNKKQIKIVNFKVKKYMDTLFDFLNCTLERLETENLIDNEMVEAFKCDQFKDSKPFKPAPEKIEKRIDSMENNCLINAPLVIVNKNGNNFKIPLSKIFHKKEFDYFDKEEYFFKKVNFSNETVYINDKYQTNFLNNKINSLNHCPCLGDAFTIGNGMVSGLDKAFKLTNDNGLSEDEIIKVCKAADLNRYTNDEFTDYIFVNHVNLLDDLKQNHKKVFDHLINFKDRLNERYNYNRDIPFWHWVFLRNKELMESSYEKIFVPCKERIDKRKYIRFAFVKGNVYATQDVTTLVKKEWVKENILYFVGILNSELLFNWIKYKGLIRGGVAEFSEEPLSIIPIRFINWDKQKEVRIHDEIVFFVNEIINNKNNLEKNKKEIEKRVEYLYLNIEM